MSILSWRRRAASLVVCLALSEVACRRAAPPEVVDPVVPPSVARISAVAHPWWRFDLRTDAAILPSGWTLDARPENSASPPRMDCACSAGTKAPVPLAGTPGSDEGLRGNYKNAPFQHKAEGCCWVTTGEPEWRGVVRTPWFRPFARYLHFRVRVGPEQGPPPDASDATASSVRVELYTDRLEWPIRVEEIALEGARERYVWDLSLRPVELPSGPRTGLKLVVVDDASRTVSIKDVIATDQEVLRDEPPVWGIADLHAHPFSNLGFGGAIFHGSPHSSIGQRGELLGVGVSQPAKALGDCKSVHLGRDGSDQTNFANKDWDHVRSGSPDYAGWPRFDVVIEQQMYIDWIRRAAQGGVRLVNVDVLNSVANHDLVQENWVAWMSRLEPGVPTTPETTASEAWNIDRQTRALQRLVALPDVKDWAGVAASAAEARALIGAGKLALVPGVEVDDLGEITNKLSALRYESQMRAMARTYVAFLRRAGIRHVFPAHLTDNGLSGAAFYDGLFPGATAYLQGRYVSVADGEPYGIFYRLDQDRPGLPLIVSVAARTGMVVVRPFTEEEKLLGGHRNAAGLSRAGWVFLEELARAGMLIDLDHMSERATEESLCFAETVGYPVMFSHTGFRDLGFVPSHPLAGKAGRSLETHNPKHFTDERMRTAAQIVRMRNTGGIVGVGTGESVLQSSRWHPRRAELAEQLDRMACDGSSITFARQYLYAVEATGGQGVALGTDENGFSNQLVPRFGPFACMGVLTRERGEKDRADRRTQIGAQRFPLRYDGACVGTTADAKPQRCPLRRDPRRFENGVDADGSKGWAIRGDIWRAIWSVDSGEADTEARRCDGRRAAEQGSAAAQLVVRDLAQGLRMGRIRGGAFHPVCAPSTESACAQRISYMAAQVDGEHCLVACANLPAECSRDMTCLGRCEELRDIYRRWYTGDAPLLKKSVLENAEFDFNVDGLAHYGLLPDMLQDLRNIGLRDVELAPLFRSAEDYLRMWEMAEERAAALEKDDEGQLGRIAIPGLSPVDWATCGRPALP